MEFLEKEKIMFPIRRVISPVSYLKIINRVYQDPQHPYFGKTKFYLPDHLHRIHKLHTKICDFSINRNYFHALDKRRYRKYCRDPKRIKFLKWKEYEKYVGQSYGHDNYESVAKHYYSYWQSYYFYEITNACTLKYVVNVFDDDMRKKLWQLKIPTDEILSYSLPLRYEKKNGDFLGQYKNFEMLSFYIQSIQKFNNLVSMSSSYEKSSLGNLLEPAYLRYKNYQRRFACFVVNKYKIEKKTAFEFLKFLVNKYYNYGEQKKNNLQDFIKNDIHYLITLMEHAFNISFDQISDQLGKAIPSFSKTLDVIFPKEFSQERENILHTLKSYLTSKLNFYRFENVSKDEIYSFLCFLENNNLQLFYYSLGQINITQFRNQTVKFHKVVYETLYNLVVLN